MNLQSHSLAQGGLSFSDWEVIGHLTDVALRDLYPGLTKMLKITYGEDPALYFSIEDNKILNPSHLTERMTQLIDTMQAITPPPGDDAVYSDGCPDFTAGILTAGLKNQIYPPITTKYRAMLKDTLWKFVTKKKSRSMRFTINSETL